MGTALLAAFMVFGAVQASADDDDYDDDSLAEQFVHGAPAQPSEAWLLAAGGRIYDKWWAALDRDEPGGTHPLYPATGQQSGKNTWRCEECHGWDYRGAAGIYRNGSHATGIKGIEGAIGWPEDKIAALMRGSHAYTPEMINDAEMARLAAFVSRGQIDMSAYIDPETRQVTGGDADRGRAVFQTVCAACHGFDGRRLDWGDDGEHAYIGTEAAKVPDEVLNKILNAHPGEEMVNLRAFSPDVAADVLRYTTTLPTK